MEIIHSWYLSHVVNIKWHDIYETDFVKLMTGMIMEVLVMVVSEVVRVMEVVEMVVM